MSEIESILPLEEANELVLEHQGWSESIARAVARSWSMDWRANGLDGAAYEALIFCSRRFDPELGVPFKGYARRRIHEASTEAARKSKGWTRYSGSEKRTERLARNVSAELFDAFPELRSGKLPFDNDSKGQRAAIQQLLLGASIIVAKQGIAGALPDEAIEYKSLITKLTRMEPVHQQLIWMVYWEGRSLRNVGKEWDTDELNVIREHKVLLEYIQKCHGKGDAATPPRVRPGLKPISLKIAKQFPDGKFHALMEKNKERGV